MKPESCAKKRFIVDVSIVILAWGTLVVCICALIRPVSAIQYASSKESEVLALREFALDNLKTAISSDEIVLVDARGERSFVRGHLPKAVSLPRALFDFKLDELNLQNSEKTIVVYCSDAKCGDAERVARRLQKKGFQNVGIYRGGWDEWRRSR